MYSVLNKMKVLLAYFVLLLLISLCIMKKIQVNNGVDLLDCTIGVKFQLAASKVAIN